MRLGDNDAFEHEVILLLELQDRLDGGAGEVSYLSRQLILSAVASWSV